MKKLALFLSFLFVISCSKDTIIYTLTTSANPAEGGTVSPTSATFEEGQTATITASPTSDYLFQSWSGATGSTNSTSIVMNSNKTVTANFVKKKFALTVSVEGEGTVTEKVIKAGAATDYTIGSVIELTANPSDEWLFVEWKGDVTGTKNPVEITIDKAKNVLAVFAKKPIAYLDDNGVTIKANSWAEVGDTVEIDGVTYTIVDEATLRQMIANEEDITKVVTSKVTNMSSLFRDTKFNQEIDSWDTSNVTNMRSMFNGASSFNQEIDSWDTSNVTNMNTMFIESQFNKDISKWDVSSVTDMGLMFRDSQFNGDISKWDVSNVTNMEQLFSSAKFTGDISEWNVSSVKNMFRLFFDAAFRGDISNWDVSSVTNMSSVFNSTINDVNFDLSKWDVSSVTDMSGLFWATDFNGDISSWDVSNVKNMNETFGNASSFNQDIKSWNVSNVEDMGSMFTGARSFNQDLSSWDVSNVTNMNRMFSYALVFNQDLSKWCVTNINSEPTDFSTSSELTEANKPLWGTCPGNSYTIAVTASSNADYTFSGEDRNGDVSGNDPNLTFKVGDEVTFSVNAANHPFYLKTAAGTGTDNQISGVTNQGTTNGDVVWTPTEAGTYYYQCSAHSGMVGTITIE